VILLAGQCVDLVSGCWLGVANFLDGRGDDWRVVLGVMKFKMHAAAYVLELEHGASPGGAGDGYLNWVGTKLRMAGNHGMAAAEQDGGVAVVESLDFQNGGGREVVEKNSAFDFGLNDGVIHVIGQVGVRDEHG
jgi:hypothetical protein